MCVYLEFVIGLNIVLTTKHNKLHVKGMSTTASMSACVNLPIARKCIHEMLVPNIIRLYNI